MRDANVLALAHSIARARHRGPYRANRVRQSIEERERALAAAEAKRERRRARNRRGGPGNGLPAVHW